VDSRARRAGQDDPDHVRLRALVSKAFTPRFIERLRGRIEALCEELLDVMERERKREGATDWERRSPGWRDRSP
jgi:cytochrome P450